MRREKTGREKKQDKRREKMKKREKMKGKMKEKMKRDRDERKEDFFVKNVSEPSNPPDALAQNVSKKHSFRTNYSSIFLRKFRI